MCKNHMAGVKGPIASIPPPSPQPPPNGGGRADGSARGGRGSHGVRGPPSPLRASLVAPSGFLQVWWQSSQIRFGAIGLFPSRPPPMFSKMSPPTSLDITVMLHETSLRFNIHFFNLQQPVHDRTEGFPSDRITGASPVALDVGPRVR